MTGGRLQVTEIYTSVQGEASFAGWPCTFVRLTGCPLRCRWCDTVYGFQGGESYRVEEIVTKVAELGVSLVELTGGEPLAQEMSRELIDVLIRQGYKVLIETSGAQSLEDLPPELHIIMDLKCPGSGMQEHNLWQNLDWLKASDEIKFVVADRRDYEWAKDRISEHNLSARFNILMSPAFGLLAPKDLVAWFLEDRLNVRLNLQQHKFIWSPRAKGV